MSPLSRGMATVAALVAAMGAGVWAGQHGLLTLPWAEPPAAMDTAHSTKPSGAVIYYRDPDMRPFYALVPRKTDDGRDYVPVLASEDVSFDPKPLPEAASGERKIKFYRNPMGLPDTSTVPKKDSMGMDYIPVYDGEESDDGSVTVSPGKLQRTGVETTLVGRHVLTHTIKAPGVVELDERRVAVVAPRYDGFIAKVGPATTATHVRKGDELVTLFSQEVVGWAANLSVENIGDRRSSPTAGDGNGRSFGAARRLENLGVPADFIEIIRKTGQVPNTFVVRAPLDGVVLERNAVDGQAFKSGDVLFRMADHSVVWMMADLSEGDIDAIAVGQDVQVTTRARPGRIFKGIVAVIYPHLMKETRTARVRIELANADLALLPDMYGDVAITTGEQDPVVAVPISAVIDSGSRQVVLVDRSEGRFEPRAVRVGRKGDGYAEILDGIAEGDRVVVNGNFLIDAESNLQAALKPFEQATESKP
ncbi:efflux transporter periplasmic adaptor subunit [Hyphomicrobium methylovorum]|nr:efflux transporter periplasmic adaptor subunit [Hyphomicrobium methylovorum]